MRGEKQSSGCKGNRKEAVAGLSTAVAQKRGRNHRKAKIQWSMGCGEDSMRRRGMWVEKR